MQVDQPESFPPFGQLVKVNGLKAVYAKKGDMPLEYAINHNVRYERLLEINEIADRPLQSDMYLYLERKRFKGLKPTHTVQQGETIAKIAQYEGMQLKSLKELNQLSDGEEPAQGAILYLQQEAPARPAVNIASATAAIGTTGAVAQAVLPTTPESQFIETGNAPATEAQVRFAANTEATPVTAQPKEIGPALVPEAVKANDAQEASEPAGILPPAPPVEVAQADVKTSEAVTVNPPVNIANEKPVEEVIAEEKAKALREEEPKDELAVLKAKFDKVVYAPKTSPEVQPAVEPVVEAPVVIEEPKAEKPVATGAKFYVVKKGDTAFGIAKRNNITVKELMDWNKLDFEGIKIGQKLRVKQ
jgi:LysM repeat protein